MPEDREQTQAQPSPPPHPPAQPTRAPVRTGYSVRILVIGLALIGGGLWFLYDGLVTYPRQQEIYEAYQQVREEHTDWRTRWSQVAAERDWPISDSAPQARSDGDILVQRIFAAVLLPLGLVVGVTYLRLLGRWIACDEQGLRTSWGEHAPWESIRSVDKSRWQRKGIAVVHYDSEGREGSIKLDDWKYDTAAIDRMLTAVEAHLAAQQGSPEAGESANFINDQPASSSATEGSHTDR